MKGIAQKVKDVVKGGHHGEETANTSGTATGSSYTNVGATVGAAGAPGIAGPVAPAATGTYGEGYETRGATGEVPMAVEQTTTTTTPGAYTEGYTGRSAATGVVEGGPAETCAQEYYTKVEDRPVVKERVELVQEHRPVEKEFVVETRATGAEREVASGQAEHLGTTEHIVGVTQPKAPCE